MSTYTRIDIDKDTASTSLTIGAQDLVVAKYTYQHLDQSIIIQEKTDPLVIPLSLFTQSLSEVGTWITQKINPLFSPSRIDPSFSLHSLHLELVDPDTYIIDYYIAKNLFVRMQYTHSTQLMSISPHQESVFSYNQFVHLLHCLSFFTDQISSLFSS